MTLLTVLIAITGFGAACAAAVVDLRSRRIPNIIVGPAVIAVAVLCVAAAAEAHKPSVFFVPVACAGAVFCVYASLSVANSVGMGDVKLGALLGLTCGAFGWPAAVAGTILGFIVGGAFCAFAMMSRQRRRADLIPWAPWMVCGMGLGLALFGV